MSDAMRLPEETLDIGNRPRRIASVFWFPNGNVAVCDQHGRQMPEFQGGTHREMRPLIDAQVAKQTIKPTVRGWPHV